MAIMARTVATGMCPPATAQEPLRRCTFRHLSTITNGRALPVYEASCTHPEREDPRSLGDLDSARAMCRACTLIGIFRPDSD
jgi:hypothetical protein